MIAALWWVFAVWLTNTAIVAFLLAVPQFVGRSSDLDLRRLLPPAAGAGAVITGLLALAAWSPTAAWLGIAVIVGYQGFQVARWLHHRQVAQATPQWTEDQLS
jgi:hypothetical protein